MMATVLPEPANRAARDGACLARPNDDGVEVLHAVSAPSMWRLPYWVPLRDLLTLGRHINRKSD